MHGMRETLGRVGQGEDILEEDDLPEHSINLEHRTCPNRRCPFLLSSGVVYTSNLIGLCPHCGTVLTKTCIGYSM